jgi:hypothetical protein
LHPIRNSMQKPIEGRSTQLLSKLYKGTITNGAIVFPKR